MALKVKEETPDVDPADVLNGDVDLPAGQAEGALDPESDVEVPLEAEELQEALGRPPPVHSSYLPLPWKGRLGYVSCEAVGSWICLTRKLTRLGLPEYLFALLESSCLLLSYLSHRLYPREPTPTPRP